MFAYIVRRLIFLPVVLIGVTVMVFGMLQFLNPYQRVFVYVPDPTKITGEGLDQLIEEYGLKDPFPVQYFRWMNGILHGNLGWSATANMSVMDALLDRFPASLELTLFSLFPLVFLGIWLGEISAVHHNALLDHITRVIAITGWSFPPFVFGIMVLMVFYGVLGWFPPGRLSTWADAIVNGPAFSRYTGLNTLDALLNGNFAIFLDALRHLILPVVTLSYVSWAWILRVMRSSMLEILQKDYITTARAKGLSEQRVIAKHARRNALMPTLTVCSLLVLLLLGGVVITETIFDYEGMGRWVANAALQLDMPSVVGFALFNGFVMVVINLIVDLLYAYIDPRVKYD